MTRTKLNQNQIGGDGWQLADETWAYASASTITVPSGAAAKYAVGDRIKWTQTTVKYGVIVVVADTLLTIAVNTDFTVATPTAITDNYYSHQDTPIGFPSHFNFVPVFVTTLIDNGSGGQPTISYATYNISGCKFKFTVMGTGTKVGLGSYIGFAYGTLPAFKSKPGTSVIGIGSGALNSMCWVSHEVTNVYVTQATDIADNATCLFRIFGEWPI